MALWGPYSRLGSDEQHDKPLPSLPSPTLTNPDLVLPDEPFSHSLPSPARTVRQTPSITYLHAQPDDPSSLNRVSLNVEQRLLDGYHGPTNASSSSQRSGSGTRTLQLGRGESGDGYVSDAARSRTPTSIDRNASSPLERDRLNVASHGPVRRPSSSSMDSEEMAKMPDFLNKYKNMDTTSEEEITDIEGATTAETQAYKEERRVKREEEQMSLLLSQRAEEILANAKKRLNLMEGNLRGARDLVAPLTAANLKRATSLSSSFGSPSMAYTHRRLDSMAYDSDPYQPRRTLYSQASSPAMRSDYYTHARVSSENELIDRPYTAFSSRSGYINRSPRFPVKPSEAFMAAATSSPTAANASAALRQSRSYDSFGINRINTATPQQPQQYSRESPISSLEPVSEDEHKYLIHPRNRATPSQPNTLTVPRGAPSVSGSSATTSEDLRDQMESLKGRISSLKERAREDSLRRSSQNNLRQPSPLNDASHAAPEFWYTQPSNYGIAADDAEPDEAPIDRSRDDSPTAPHFNASAYNFGGQTGSRNAFAERKSRDEGLAAQSSASGGSSPVDKRQSYFSNGAQNSRRGSAGTAILASNKKQSPAHQPSRSREMPGAFDRGQFDSSDEYESDLVSDGTSLMPNSEPSTPEPNGPDEDEDEDESDEFDFEQASIYEDAERDQPEMIAHEDREDAFDYEHFFLHSAMGSYSSGRDSPDDSDLSSVSSADTARAPQYQHDDLEDYDDAEENEDSDQVEEIAGDAIDESYESEARGTTPDALRQIEARLQQAHGRTMSTESLDTINTFATATEGRETPSITSRSASRAELPVTPTEPTRPNTAVRTDPSTAPAFAKSSAVTSVEGDDVSDRADSGVGGLSQANSQGTPRSTAGPDSDGTARSPPASPARTVVSQHHRALSRQYQQHRTESAANAIKSLLEPTGKPLDSNDEAVVLSLVESLRNICVRLQKEQDSQQGDTGGGEPSIDEVVERSKHYEGQILRKRLEDARRVLDGLGVGAGGSTPTSPVLK